MTRPLSDCLPHRRAIPSRALPSNRSSSTIFVLGEEPAPLLPGVSPVAMQQGRFVAKVIESRARGHEPPREFRYLDKGIMATIGRSRAVAQTGKLRMSGLAAWLVVHIFYLIGFRNRFVVLFNWAWSYVTYKRGARLITGERAWERAQRLAARAEHRDDGAAAETRPTESVR